MSRLSLLLLVDQDQKGLETLTYGFEREGCTVAATSDPAMAPDLVRTTSPQLVVVAVHDPPAPALDLVRAFRADDETRVLPIIATGAPAVSSAVKQAGATDFLPVPVYVRDAITVGRLLAASGGANGTSEVRGSLSDYGLFYLVRAMIATGRSGVLTIERANRKGEMRFAGGELVSAQVGSQQGYAAFHQLLLWEQALMELTWKGVIKRGNQFSGKPEELLDDGERFLRDFAAAAKDLGSAQSVFAQEVARITQIQSSIPVEVGPVIRLFDGQRTLSDVIEDSPFRVFDTVRIAIRLVDMGALKLREDQVERTPAPSNSRPALDEWLQKAPQAPGQAPDPARGALDKESGKADARDHRSGGSRRKTIRRDRLETDEPAKPAAQPEMRQAPQASAAIPAAQPRITSGSMEARRDDPRTSVKAMPAVTGGPSIVVDMGPTVMVEGTTREPAPVAVHAPGVIAAVQPITSPKLGSPRPRQMTPPPVIVPPPVIAPPPGIAATPAAAPRARQMTPPPIAKVPPLGAFVPPAADPRARIATPPPVAARAQADDPRARMITPPPVAKAPAPGTWKPPVADPRARVATPPPPTAHAARDADQGVRFATPPAAVKAPAPAPAPVPAAATGGIEIDPALLAEMQAMEAAEAQPAPPAPAAARAEAPAAVIPQVVPIPAALVPIAPPQMVSPPVPLVASKPAPMTASPAPSPFGHPAAAAPPAAPQADTHPVSRPAPASGRRRPTTGRHRLTPSSAFNALEADFFAREADLYKEDEVESFDDLDKKTDPDLLAKHGGRGGGPRGGKKRR